MVLINYKDKSSDLHMSGIMPGQLQYNLSQEDALSWETPEGTPSSNENWIPIQSDFELLRKLTPKTDKGKKACGGIIYAIKRTINDQICIKAALRNIATGKIALITTCNEIATQSGNSGDDGSRKMDSVFGAGWKIYRSKMIAPASFWEGVKEAIQD